MVTDAGVGGTGDAGLALCNLRATRYRDDRVEFEVESRGRDAAGPNPRVPIP